MDTSSILLLLYKYTHPSYIRILSFSSFVIPFNHNSTNLTPSINSISNPSAYYLALFINELVVTAYSPLAFCLTILEWSMAIGSKVILSFLHLTCPRYLLLPILCSKSTPKSPHGGDTHVFHLWQIQNFSNKGFKRNRSCLIKMAFSLTACITFSSSFPNK